MSGAATTGDGGEESRRVEELLRVNAELAAEIRRIAAAEIDAPRRSTVPSARRVAKLRAERDELLARLEAAEREVARIEAHNEELGLQVDEQDRELARLRAGAAGLLRRLRARALRR